MQARDLVRFTAGSVLSHRLRSGLTALGIGIGVTAVVLLTSIGAGLHEYMLAEFTQFGTNIIAILSECFQRATHSHLKALDAKVTTRPPILQRLYMFLRLFQYISEPFDLGTHTMNVIK